jgi:NAD(P)-dependent dehydrogenase (short-subunit alcohol dehydrogenase family)
MGGDIPPMSSPNACSDKAQLATDGSARDKVIVVTGASSGLGLETAKQLASQGAEIVMVCRDRSRGQRAQSQIAQVAAGKSPALFLADLSVQAEIRRVGEQISHCYD